MQLTPRERDTLLISMIAEVTRKRLQCGAKLNRPEAIALIPISGPPRIFGFIQAVMPRL